MLCLAQYSSGMQLPTCQPKDDDQTVSNRRGGRQDNKIRKQAIGDCFWRQFKHELLEFV